MTAPQTKLRMQQILASIGTGQSDAEDSTDAVEYNWHQPHCFSLEQLEMLDKFSKLLAQNISQELSRVYHAEFEFKHKSSTLHFADQLIFSQETKDNFFLTFAPDNKPFGIIQIPSATAATLISKLLGENNPQPDQVKELSQLELSLLSDFASAMIDPVGGSLSREDLKPLGSICADEIPADLPGTEEIYKLTLSVQSDEKNQIHVLLLCQNLEDQLGKNHKKEKPPTPDENRNAMLSHIEQIDVTVTARLGKTDFPFEDLMNLQAGDVLMLEKKIDQPIELLVKDKPVFRGTPAMKDGKFAAVITETVN